MVRAIPMVLIILCITLFAVAETVSLTGTVKKTGVGIPGVKVSLKKFPTKAAISTAEGAFTISGSTAVLQQAALTGPYQLIFRNNSITFSPSVGAINGLLEIYSSDGKRKISVNLDEVKNRSILLPELGSGINILRLTIGTDTYTRELVSLGDGMFLNSILNDGIKIADFKISKRVATAAVDTLIASKDNYNTSKTAITSYSQQNIVITIDTAEGTAPGKCTRDGLMDIARKYIEAQKAGDLTKMPLASGVTYTENFKSVTEDKCFFKKAIKIDSTRIFCDVDSCAAFVEIISANNTPPYVLMTWLKVNNGQISNITAIVSTTGDWAFNASDYLKNSSPQDWEILADSMRVSRQVLINGANAYLDAFVPKTKSDTIPWGIPCERIEGGASTGNTPTSTCNVGVPSGVEITNRSYVIDLEKATIDVFCEFGGGMPDSHMFRMLKGKYRYVHTLSIQNKDLP